MTRIEVEYKGVKGVLTDGYFPKDFSYFKNIDWGTASKEKFSSPEEVQDDVKNNIYRRFMTPKAKEPNAAQRSNFYRKTKEMVEKGFCPYGKMRCAQFQFPAIGAKNMKKIISRGTRKRPDIKEKMIPAISNEIDSDLSVGKNTYVFHLAYLDLKPGNYCSSFEQCSTNWMDFMSFQTKKEEEYVDFEKFKNAAEMLLKRDIERNVPSSEWFEE